MANEERFNATDEVLLHKRVEILIRSVEEGIIDPDAFCDLFEMQKDPKVVEEERSAYRNQNSSYEDSPYGRLLQRYIRCGGRFKDLTHE